MQTHGLPSLYADNILADLLRASKAKSGIERESALLGLASLFNICGQAGGADPYFLPLWPEVLERFQEVGKAQVVADAAERASRSLLALVKPETTVRTMNLLFDYLESSSIKWRSKAAALDTIAKLTSKGKDQVAEHLGEIIPRLTKQMSDTKAEVSSQFIVAPPATDQPPRYPTLPSKPPTVSVVSSQILTSYLSFLSLSNVSVPLSFSGASNLTCSTGMAHPNKLAEGVKKLSSNVWVRDVDGPTLAVIVPLIQRSLNDRNTTVQRQTVMLCSNLFKLVRSPDLAAKHTPHVLPGVTRIYESAAFPEIREFAKEAKQALEKSVLGAADNVSEEAEKKQLVDDANQAFDMLHSLYAKETGVASTQFAETSLRWVAQSEAQLVQERDFAEEQWFGVYVGPYLARLMPDLQAKAMTAEVLKRWLDVDQKRNMAGLDDVDDSDGEVLTNIPFSLAYGGLLLLNHTVLRLIRGHRYGVCGKNGCGKSTLLKAINRHQIENFPEHLSTFYVEHDIDGAENAETCHQFMLNDAHVQKAGASPERILKLLEECGFTEDRRALGVSMLSGGWKMRLALARAMICGADVLLLDEPTNHLDVQSVAWLQDYLKAQTQVTVLTVSHDSGFLDAICTDILHYENKRLVYYKGNLKDFVDQHPAAEAYYTLSASIVKFSFPPPGALAGVRSQTRGILKMTVSSTLFCWSLSLAHLFQNCTYTYSGRDKPSLHNVSCAVSLSSRVGIGASRFERQIDFRMLIRIQRSRTQWVSQTPTASCT